MDVCACIRWSVLKRNISHRTTKKKKQGEGGPSFTQAWLLSLSLSVSSLSLRDADSVEQSERSWVKKNLPPLTWHTTLCLSRGRCVRVWISACSVACFDARHAGRSAWLCSSAGSCRRTERSSLLSFAPVSPCAWADNPICFLTNSHDMSYPSWYHLCT